MTTPESCQPPELPREEQGAPSFRTAGRGTGLQPEGRRWRLGFNPATPQEPAGLGHGCDSAAASRWYLTGQIPAEASFLTELKIKGGWGRGRVRLVSAPGCVRTRFRMAPARPQLELGHGDMRGGDTGRDKPPTSDKRRKVFSVSSALLGGQRQGTGPCSLLFWQAQGWGSHLRRHPAHPGEHCCPVLAAPMALLISLHHPPPKP